MNLLDIARSALAEDRADETSFRWKVTLPGSPAIEVCGVSPYSRQELTARYPGAMVEPMPDESVRTTAPDPADGWPADDRRPCRECRNLTVGGRCMAAWRGELRPVPGRFPVFGRDYSPVADLPRRCEQFRGRGCPHF